MLAGCDNVASLSTTREQEGVEEAHFQKEEKHPRGKRRAATTPHSHAVA
jgi:hypothetical protein